LNYCGGKKRASTKPWEGKTEYGRKKGLIQKGVYPKKGKQKQPNRGQMLSLT